jgi:hypothetical protein
MPFFIRPSRLRRRGFPGFTLRASSPAVALPCSTTPSIHLQRELQLPTLTSHTKSEASRRLSLTLDKWHNV